MNFDGTLCRRVEIHSKRRILLGRERELAELQGGLADLIRGHGGLFLISGEPGIGKTRLADELGRVARERGIVAHWGRASEVGGAPSYWPFIQALRSMFRQLDPSAFNELVQPHATELAELLPELRQRFRGLARADQSRDRFQLFDTVNALLHAIAASGPQLLVLDDLHAADPSSLSLLHFIVRDLQRSLLVIGTYREVEVRMAPEVAKTIAQIAREACVLPLRRLDRQQTSELVVQTIGELAPDRIDAIHRRTEGNPLFLHELLQLDDASARLPAGIQEVVQARLALLAPDVRRTLEAAAVLGRELEVRSVVAAIDLPDPEVRRSIEAAADAGVVELLDADRCRFTHVLLREAIYGAVDANRRATLHRAAAAELRRRDGELTEIAHHLLGALPTVSLAEVTDAVMRAADRAMTMLAFEDACALLARMIELLAGIAGEQRRLFEVQLALGLAQCRAADVELGRRTCLQAADLARRLGDGRLLARAVLGAVYEFSPGVRDDAMVALLEEALAALPPNDDPLRARCMVQLAAERLPEPDPRAAVELAREAVAMARRIGDTDTLRFTLSVAGLAMMVVGEPDERLAIDQEALRLGLEAKDTLVAVRAHLLLQSDLWELGDRSGAVAHGLAYEALVSQSRHDRFRWVSSLIHAVRLLCDGKFDDADRAFRSGEAVAHRDEARGATSVAFPIGQWRAAERPGELPALEARIRGVFGTAALPSCIGEMLVAQLYGRAGDRQRAASQLATVRAHPVFGAIREPSWLALLVEPCHLLGEVTLAEALYPMLLPRARRMWWLGPLGAYYEPPYARFLGLLAETLGRHDAAIDHLVEAEAITVRAGMRGYFARLRYELAGALLARGRPEDRVRAASLLEDAQTLAEQLGQQLLLAAIAARAMAAPAMAAPAVAATVPAPGIDRPAFAIRREGEYWTVVHADRTSRVRDSRGMQVLAELLANPGQEVHVLQLVSRGDHTIDAGDAGSVLDPTAIASYRRRLLDLREQLEEAEGFGDSGRAERARDEIEVLTAELARAVGLGGRERRAGGAAERARTTIQKRVRSAIRKIEEDLPELGRHLDQTIRTGMFCGYLPDGRARRS